MQPARCVGRILVLFGLAVWASATFAQQAPAGRGQAAAAPAPATRPPLLFKEEWREPPFEGERNDVNQRFTPYVVTNDRVEAKLYGPDSHVIRAAQHEGRIDLWTGMSTSPVAVTLRDKRNYVDLTGLARLRWIVRTNAIHTLYPVVKLADGTMIVGTSWDFDRRRVPAGGSGIWRHEMVQAGSGKGRRPVGSHESGSH